MKELEFHTTVKGDVLNIGAKYLFDKLYEARTYHQFL